MLQTVSQFSCFQCFHLWLHLRKKKHWLRLKLEIFMRKVVEASLQIVLADHHNGTLFTQNCFNRRKYFLHTFSHYFRVSIDFNTVYTYHSLGTYFLTHTHLREWPWCTGNPRKQRFPSSSQCADKTTWNVFKIELLTSLHTGKGSQMSWVTFVFGFIATI